MPSICTFLLSSHIKWLNCRQFGSGAEVWYGHFGTSAKLFGQFGRICLESWCCRSVLGPNCLGSKVSVHLGFDSVDDDDNWKVLTLGLEFVLGKCWVSSGLTEQNSKSDAGRNYYSLEVRVAYLYIGRFTCLSLPICVMMCLKYLLVFLEISLATRFHLMCNHYSVASVCGSFVKWMLSNAVLCRFGLWIAHRHALVYLGGHCT